MVEATPGYSEFSNSPTYTKHSAIAGDGLTLRWGITPE